MQTTTAKNTIEYFFGPQSLLVKHISII